MAVPDIKLFRLTGSAECLEYKYETWIDADVTFYRLDRERPVLPYEQLIADYEQADAHDRLAFEGAVDRLFTDSEARSLRECLSGLFPEMGFIMIEERLPVAKARLQSMVVRHRRNQRREIYGSSGDGPGFGAGMRIDFRQWADATRTEKIARLKSNGPILGVLPWEAHEPCPRCGEPTDPQDGLHVLDEETRLPLCDRCAASGSMDLLILRDIYIQAQWDARKRDDYWALWDSGYFPLPRIHDHNEALARVSGRDYTEVGPEGTPLVVERS